MRFFARIASGIRRSVFGLSWCWPAGQQISGAPTARQPRKLRTFSCPNLHGSLSPAWLV